jgi:hypothetical protein
MTGQPVRRMGPVAAGGSRAAGSVTRSPDSPLFERRTRGRAGTARGATHPVSVEPGHE